MRPDFLFVTYVQWLKGIVISKPFSWNSTLTASKNGFGVSVSTGSPKTTPMTMITKKKAAMPTSTFFVVLHPLLAQDWVLRKSSRHLIRPQGGMMPNLCRSRMIMSIRLSNFCGVQQPGYSRDRIMPRL